MKVVAAGVLGVVLVVVLAGWMAFAAFGAWLAFDRRRDT